MFSRTIARITVMGFVFAALGLIVGLVGKYALKSDAFDNPFWVVAVGLFVGAMVGGAVSRRIESARTQRTNAPPR